MQLSTKLTFVDFDSQALPIMCLTPAEFQTWILEQDEETQNWVARMGVVGKAGDVLVSSSEVIAIVEHALAHFAAIPEKLKGGTYYFEGLEENLLEVAVLAWGMATYRYQEFKTGAPVPKLVWPEDIDRGAFQALIESITFVRDMINQPANLMNPQTLAQKSEDLAKSWGAEIEILKDQDRLQKEYPLVHAVGKASATPPCLIDVRWGNPAHPKLTLIGKGVTFDSGGLDLKSSSNMLLMKKDMGGAAHVLALAHLIIHHKLPVRLRVLIPAVENAVSGTAIRPGDIFKSRKGLTVEIGNTDAEGRLILADALAEADSENPDLVIDFATLTGAARIAVGTEIGALFSNQKDLLWPLQELGDQLEDPLWPLPLWSGYESMIASKFADVNNVGTSSYAGATLAALFMKKFIEAPWIHIDMMAWNITAKPGKPEGGEAMGLRTIFAYLMSRYSVLN
ncbi:Leucyl aminopeptidase family protein [Candidatus Bealeia paramacronuclearis]|uniref:Leucyl aminopeptidase family protein n=1 Tax=Candidatus Bealeia paramacronuclearis TaxID=1921001 RepID=A0ABZ2C7I2_9PROT|nr:Leucyl aminopeptidase family protein [Candidatus Bealeia paramacronuclearis]